MSGTVDPKAPEERDSRDSHEHDAMSALLKRSLSAKEEEVAPPKELLRGVQRRIRARSRGKFYADGWSTSTSRVNPLLVAVVMLVVLGVAYFALGPMGVSR
jgi:hypothetical protein